MGNELLEDDQELVSIIIPVYNTDEYLERCVDSLLDQTYSKLEILLIDDGSTDNSSMICDNYARMNKKVKVIHQCNMGLARVRNNGIKYSKGKYISFVDSDDWVHEKYVEILYTNMISFDASVSSCSIKRVDKEISCGEIDNEIEIWNSSDALRAMLQQDGFTSSACASLYERSLFEGIEYPDQSLYEDLATTYKVLNNSKKIAKTKSELYFYYSRPGSIDNSRYTSKHFIEIKYAEDIASFVEKKYPQINYAAQERIVGVCFHLYMMMDKDQRKTEEASYLLETIKTK